MSMDKEIKALKDVTGKEFRKGVIDVKEETVVDAKRVMEQFNSFGGEGWLQVVDSPDIKLLGKDDKAEATWWPLLGERVNDKKSLHLRRTQAGWSLSILTEVGEKEGLLVEKSLLAKDGSFHKYVVGYSIQEIMEQKEWRPMVSRFAGISKGGK